MNPELAKLHTDVAQALAGESFQPEARPYHPHITLARCGPEVPSSLVSEFLSRHRGFALPDIPIRGFALYSSVFQGAVPRYRCERLFC